MLPFRVTTLFPGASTATTAPSPEPPSGVGLWAYTGACTTVTLLQSLVWNVIIVAGITHTAYVRLRRDIKDIHACLHDRARQAERDSMCDTNDGLTELFDVVARTELLDVIEDLAYHLRTHGPDDDAPLERAYALLKRYKGEE